jgi:hypothetical protein
MIAEQAFISLRIRYAGFFIALVCFPFHGCTTKDTVIQPALYKDAIILSLSFDGSTADASRYANIGNGVNAAYVVGKTNQGIHLSSSTLSYVYYPDAIYFHTPTVTAEAWIRMDTTRFAMTILTECPQAAAAVGKGYILGIEDNHLQFIIGGASGAWSFVAGNSSLQTNVWYHVVGLYDGQNLKVFINGQIDGSNALGVKSISYQPSPGSGPTPPVFYVGVRHNAFDSLPTHQADLNYPFIGTIDNVRIYDRALSDAEIQQVFQASN